VTRKRFETSDSIDASNRLVGTHHSAGYRTECHFAVSPLQLAKSFRTVFKLDHCLIGWRSNCSDFFLPIDRLDWGSLIRAVWQSAHFIRYQDRVSHRLRTQPRSTHIFRPTGREPQFTFLARDLGQTRSVFERMQCAREPLLLLFRFGWAARLRHEFPRLAQRVAGLCYGDSLFPGAYRFSVICSG
jgi:hypothetical protein